MFSLLKAPHCGWTLVLSFFFSCSLVGCFFIYLFIYLFITQLSVVVVKKAFFWCPIGFTRCIVQYSMYILDNENHGG